MFITLTPGPSTIKHPTADYPTADYPKNILSATKKQRANQLPFAAKFGGSSARFGGHPPNLADDPKKKFYSTGPWCQCNEHSCNHSLLKASTFNP